MHELTKRIEKDYGNFSSRLDQIITAYMEERAEWLNMNGHDAIKKDKNNCEKCQLIKEAFQIEEESLEEMFRRCVAEQDGGFKKMCIVAKDYFKKHPEELT